ncbi:non-oxidative hydroxyarylic acid decarboxylases subunit D [Nonomuraea sp. M3C6]|uniref:Non-oxidative hydroxyarylic acid decarboxylases subunit D n=1 Tax=Nonomuraea marmarensis TaxID=3351344 RepID=A0ABW7AV35_9ACTN
MHCPRCDHDGIIVAATSPVPEVWEVFQCRQCAYMWRSTEPLRRTSREHYPAEFQLTKADIDAAPESPSIPLLRSRS